jgi:hypothetical protein
LIRCVLLHDDDSSSSLRLAHQSDPTWHTVPIAMFSIQAGGLSEVFMDALLTLAGRHCEVLQ